MAGYALARTKVFITGSCTWAVRRNEKPLTPLARNVTDAELIGLIDRWVSLLERADYEAAFALTDHLPELGWSPTQLREVIHWYGPHDPHRRVTLECAPTDITERKVVSRWPEPMPNGFFGEIWYSLNIDGKASDLTASFTLRYTAEGVTVHLEDIDVK